MGPSRGVEKDPQPEGIKWPSQGPKEPENDGPQIMWPSQKEKDEPQQVSHHSNEAL